ncbi:uncharacterized protein LOC107435633 isoform X1 [Ziziphus jujuba]|uniref:Uncharacterized protein LOC107435633 isoform X1 n=1 Tax=Ziziphus jujuba TaxID=326968 RepID=A0ABM4AFA2_ZIZJJ|nr:uncharacterized protein LOC107435633 isoform X1 [Ziziphus jujuba]
MGRQLGFIVRELLDKKNYLDWSVGVKTYLMGEDLWDIVESMDEPPKPKDRHAFKYWRSKNASALHAIQISCNTDAFSKIRDMTSAKKAWDTLEKEFNSESESESEDDDEVKIPNDQYQQYERFHKALQDGDRNATKEFITQYPDAVRKKITTRTRMTALHVAATAGHTEIVETLVEKMSPEDLEMEDSSGNIALTAAIIYNADFKIAECMVKKNKKLPTMLDQEGTMPVVLAFQYCHTEMGRYLYSVASMEDLILPDNLKHAAELIDQAIITKCHDVALHLLQLCPLLATTFDLSENTPVYTLAVCPRGRPLKFWQKWIYESIVIDGDRVIKEIYTKLSTNTKMNSDTELHGEVWSLQSVAMHFDILGFKKIYKMKLVHIQYSALLRQMCEETKKLNKTQISRSDIIDALFDAAEEGHFEFVESILKSNPDLAESYDESSRNVFMVAVQYRQAKIFSLIHGVGSKLSATNHVDDDRNNMLHMAGLFLPPPQLDRISGAALQMQSELQWFKEVESVVPPWTHGHTNNEALTPRQLFTREHKQLLSAGEKWMKETATSCTVVGALIVTIMFAATFTLPGGNDEKTGYPKFLDDKTFILFIISDAISLFSSTTSVLMFLGILTSTYAQDDFLKSLPRKLMIGLGTLFLSIAAMMISFCAAVSMMLGDNNSWVAFLIISLSSIPVTLFVLMQFPLLIEIYLSTYRPSIFGRKP